MSSFSRNINIFGFLPIFYRKSSLFSLRQFIFLRRADSADFLALKHLKANFNVWKCKLIDKFQAYENGALRKQATKAVKLISIASKKRKASRYYSEARGKLYRNDWPFWIYFPFLNWPTMRLPVFFFFSFENQRKLDISLFSRSQRSNAINTPFNVIG